MKTGDPIEDYPKIFAEEFIKLQNLTSEVLEDGIVQFSTFDGEIFTVTDEM